MKNRKGKAEDVFHFSFRFSVKEKWKRKTFSGFCFPVSLFPFLRIRKGKTENENGDRKPFSAFLFSFCFPKNETGKQKKDVENQKRESGMKRFRFPPRFPEKENEKGSMEKLKRFPLTIFVFFFCFPVNKRCKTENQNGNWKIGNEKHFPFCVFNFRKNVFVFRLRIEVYENGTGKWKSRNIDFCFFCFPGNKKKMQNTFFV